MIDTLQQWFYALSPTEQIYWGCALVSSVVFLVQAILTLIGMDAAGDMDIDIPDGDTMDVGGGLSLFSIRSLVNFFVGFGWGGVSFYHVISSKLVLGIVAILIGVAFGYMYIYLRRKLMSLEHNGAFKLSDCLGKTAQVYLRIPAAGEGMGKVQVSVGGSVHEIDAITDGDILPTGSHVRITAVQGNVLKVEKAN